MVQDNKKASPNNTQTPIDVDTILVQIRELIARLMAARNDSNEDEAAPQPSNNSTGDDDYFDMFDAMDGNFGPSHPGSGAATLLSGDGTETVATVDPASSAPGVGKPVQASTAQACGSFERATGGASGSANTISGFVCASCNAYNLIRPARDTWYAIFAGRRIGVYQGWSEVQPLVSGVRNACYRRYNSREEAQAAYDEAVANGNVRVITN